MTSETIRLLLQAACLVTGVASLVVGLIGMAAWRAIEAREEAREKARAEAMQAALAEHREEMRRIVMGGRGNEVRH